MEAAVPLVGGLATVSTNVLLIVAFARNILLRQNLTAFVLNIAVADLLKGLLLIAGTFVALIKEENVTIVTRIFTAVNFAVLLAHLLVAIIRFLAIKAPFRQKQLLRWFRITGVLGGMWIISIILGLEPWVPMQSEESTDYLDTDGSSCVVCRLVSLLGGVAIVVLYVWMLLVVRRQVSEQARRNKRAAITGLVAFVVLCVCSAPLVSAMALAARVSGERQAAMLRLIRIFYALFAIQPIVNPLIFMLRERENRRYVRDAVCCCCPRGGSLVIVGEAITVHVISDEEGVVMENAQEEDPVPTAGTEEANPGSTVN